METKIALVYLNPENKTHIGIFDDFGNIGDFQEFTTDKSFDDLGQDSFGICHYTEHEEGFHISMFARLQVCYTEEYAEEGDNYCSVQELIDDPEKDPDTFQVMHAEICKRDPSQQDAVLH